MLGSAPITIAHLSRVAVLYQVVGIDMVDDESRPERRPAKHMQTPAEWNLKHNPAYSYYAYYVYANLYILNKLREARNLNTIAFRPHAGGLTCSSAPRDVQAPNPCPLCVQADVCNKL